MKWGLLCSLHVLQTSAQFYHFLVQWWATFLPPWAEKKLLFLSQAATTTLVKVHIISIHIIFSSSEMSGCTRTARRPKVAHPYSPLVQIQKRFRFRVRVRFQVGVTVTVRSS